MPRVSAQYRQEQRERILTAAARCFARRGFHLTSMDDVIAEAGLSAGAVYGYFRGKDELIEAAAGRATELISELLPRMAAAPSPAAMLETLLALVLELAEQLDFDPTRLAMQAWAESSRSPAVSALVTTGYRAVRGHVAAAVPGWQAAGLVAADADPDEVAKVVFGLVPGYIVQHQLLGDVSPERYAAGLRALTGPRASG